jgi:hypothetical protein
MAKSPTKRAGAFERELQLEEASIARKKEEARSRHYSVPYSVIRTNSNP